MIRGLYSPDCCGKALVAQRENRWQDALQLIQQGSQDKHCGMCCWMLGYCYEIGMWSLPMKMSEAVTWYERGAALGNYRATIFLYQTGLVDKRKFKKFQWNDKDTYGNGMRYFNGTKCDTSLANAAAQFQMDAECCYSQCLMGFCCLERSKSLKDNIDDARVWYERSATQGFCLAQFFLARLICEEGGDIPLAIHWCRKAAEQQLENAAKQLVIWFLSQNNCAAALYWHKRIEHNSLNLSQYVKTRFEKIERCRKTCFTLIAIRKYRQSVFSVFPKDVVVLLAKYLWKTWHENVWLPPAAAAAEPPLLQMTTKKLKK